MNVDLNTSFGAKRLDAAGLKLPNDVAAPQVETSGRVGLSGPSLTVTTAQVRALDGLESVSEEDLRRDDALGQMVKSAFDFKPPEMPNFV